MAKIAILSFYSGHMERGVENWVFQLANRLSKNHEVVVFQNGPARKDANYKIVSTNIKIDWETKDSRGTRLRRFFLDYWSLLILRFASRSLTALLRGGFDIVIPCDNGWETLLTRILTLLIGKKLVCVGHSGKGWDERISVLMSPNVFVGLSHFAREWARAINPLIKSLYIPNGVDTDLFSPDGDRVRIDLKGPIILSAGAPEKGKRFELAIGAVAKMPSGSLLILGGGYGEEYINKLGKNLLGNRFMMVHTDFKEMPKYYRAADVFVLPAWKNEAFGMVYLEAMACGLPVVATDDPVRKEIIGEAGILVDNPEDSKDLSLAIDNALKTDWGNKPRRQAEKFSWDKIAEKYDELFRSLAK